AGATVVLGLPLDVQAQDAPAGTVPGPVPDPPGAAAPPAEQVSALAGLLRAARRPVFIAGRGATRRPEAARAALTALADRCGALLAVSAGARGLFAGDPWYLDVAGGFASPLAAELITDSDLVVAWGSTLNMWTTRHGRLISPDATVVQVDRDPAALGRNRPVDLGVAGDLVAVAEAVTAELAGYQATGWREPALRARIAA